MNAQPTMKQCVEERGGRLGFLLGSVVSIARSRGAGNREHPVTVRAPKDTYIVDQPDAGDARAVTEGTWGW